MYRVRVRGVDAAGRSGPAVPCELEVDLAAPPALVWSFDEPSGTVAASRAADGSDPLPLTLDPALDTARVPGFRGTLVGSTTDLAVTFDGGGAVARTPGPRSALPGASPSPRPSGPRRPRATAAAVSQDGTATAGSRLGQEPCASGTGSCWAFAVPTADDPAAASASVLSAVLVQPGTWVEVTGVHDAAAGTVSL